MSNTKTRSEMFNELYKEACKSLPDYKSLMANLAEKEKLKQRINARLDSIYGKDKK